MLKKGGTSGTMFIGKYIPGAREALNKNYILKNIQCCACYLPVILNGSEETRLKDFRTSTSYYGPIYSRRRNVIFCLLPKTFSVAQFPL